jgi:hypothetical protein
VPLDRFARTTIRIGLRQLQAASCPSPALAAWQAAHDRPQQDDAVEARTRPRAVGGVLEHFQEKWIPVFRSEMRQTQEPGARSVPSKLNVL